MTPLANGRIVMWQGGSLWALDVPEPPPGAPQRTDFHAHHALQLAFSLGGVFQLFAGDLALPGPAVAVGPDVRHAFEPRGRVALLFAEPESRLGRAMSAALLDGAPAASVAVEALGDFPSRIAAALSGDETDLDDRLRRLGRDLTAQLAADAAAVSPDPRVEQILGWAGENLDDRLSASAAAAQVGLSPDRMSHLFVEQTGLPFRTYVLWLRIARALAAYVRGASLTEAAHEAGFADSAHFSRTFRRMFGVAAAELRLA